MVSLNLWVARTSPHSLPRAVVTHVHATQTTCEIHVHTTQTIFDTQTQALQAQEHGHQSQQSRYPLSLDSLHSL
jgi:hypothetical protein